MKLIYVAILALVFSGAADARIKRSHSARHAFVKQTACPATGLHRLPCYGYVIDHVVPLCAGGLDKKENMQWQTIADGKAKDKLERKGCRP